MRNLTIISFLFISLTACNEKTPEQPVKSDQTAAFSHDMSLRTDSEKSAKPPVIQPINNKDVVDAKTFNDSLGWGYDIYLNGKKYIHQPNIPGVPGINGFKSEKYADKVGNLVTYKIRNNIMPPSVTIKELDSLGVMK